MLACRRAGANVRFPPLSDARELQDMKPVRTALIITRPFPRCFNATRCPRIPPQATRPNTRCDPSVHLVETFAFGVHSYARLLC